MSKKNSIILILLIFIVVMTLLLFSYFSDNDTSTNNINIENQTLPFGNSSDDVTTDIQIDTNTTTDNFVEKREKLTQIYSKPTSGTLSFTKDKKIDIRFVDRTNGNVYDYLPEEKENNLIRTTNTTIPKIQEVVWSNTGKNAIFRYLEDNSDNIISFLGKIQPASTSTTEEKMEQVAGSFLTPNIKQILINPDGDSTFELLNKKDNSGSYGVLSSIENKNKKQIFESSLSIWNILWPKDNIITFTTRPSYKDYGYMFFFNTQDLSFKRILGDILGLSTLTNKDTSLVAYSKIKSGYFYLNVYNVSKKESRELGIQTLADKCVWSKNNSFVLYCAVPQFIYSGLYPDTWYQGLTSFNDNFWMIDTEKGTTKVLYITGEIENARIDAIDLKISDNDKYLTFTNKNDLSLWMLDLKEEESTKK
ncbi:MAG: hypothetical protein WCR40_00520 [Candidatus Paceibacterota bacterium]